MAQSATETEVATKTDGAPPPTGDLRIGLALGGGGARGIAHIHALCAFDDLGVRPSAIAGTSIGALIGAAYASGLPGRDVAEYAIETFAHRRLVFSRLWRTRPPNLAEFVADGGFRFGQLNAERMLAAFLPVEMPATFEELRIPLVVTATRFYGQGGAECGLSEGDLASALAASVALPALFRPVRRGNTIYVDGGICNPLPFDLLAGACDLSVAVDVTGGPQAAGDAMPTPVEAMFGASQLMMHAIIQGKLERKSPDLLMRPPVSRYRVLDFLKTQTILAETVGLREEMKRKIAALCELRDRPLEARPARR